MKVGNVSSSKRCPVCTIFTDQGVYYYDAELTIYRCYTCSAIFLDPNIPEVAYDNDYFKASYYKNYRINYDEKLHPIPLYRSILTATRHWVSPGSRMLEVGSGLGLFLYLANTDGYRAVGVDTSAYACEYARLQMGVDVRREMLQDAGFDPGSFEVIVLNDVVEHISDPYPLLECVRKLLDYEGFLVLETPNEDALINFVSRLIYRASFGLIRSPFRANHGAEHRLYYNQASISWLLERLGFNVVEISQASIDPASRGCGMLLTAGGHLIFALSKVLNSQHKMILVAQKMTSHSETDQ